MTEELRFNENDLNVGDLEDFEEIVGASWTDTVKQTPLKDDEGKHVFKDGKPLMELKMPAKAVKAFVYIMKRKSDPDFTIEQARNVTMGELTELLGSDDPPTEATA